MKKFIWIIVIVLIVVGFYWFFFAMNSSQNGNGGVSSLKSLFPFGGANNNSTGTIANTQAPVQGSNEQTQITASYDPLIQISTRASVGATILLPGYASLQVTASTSSSTSTKNTGTSTSVVQSNTTNPFLGDTLPIVRFAEHGTGYIYDVDVRGKNETKKTGTTIVRVAEAYFGDAGNSVIFRYLKNDNATIETYLGHIVPPALGTTGQFATIKGDFLPENIPSIVMSPDQTSFAYLFATNSGVSGISMSTNGLNKKQLFSSSFDEWTLDLKQSVLTATTKPAGDIPGYAYSVLSSGIFQKIIGGINGLTTNISPDGRLLLYATSGKNNIGLFLQHQNGDSTKLSIATLPEKCVWNKSSTTIYCAVPISLDTSLTYPDAWYQGLTSFYDGIWKIDANSGATTQLTDLNSKAIDIENLILDQSGNFLIFENKNDGTLWSYDLRPVSAQKI
ncbi:MAG: hypothetical protein WCO65_03075 [bacterium]